MALLSASGNTSKGDEKLSVSGSPSAAPVFAAAEMKTSMGLKALYEECKAAREKFFYTSTDPILKIEAPDFFLDRLQNFIRTFKGLIKLLTMNLKAEDKVKGKEEKRKDISAWEEVDVVFITKVCKNLQQIIDGNAHPNKKRECIVDILTNAIEAHKALFAKKDTLDSSAAVEMAWKDLLMPREGNPLNSQLREEVASKTKTSDWVASSKLPQALLSALMEFEKVGPIQEKFDRLLEVAQAQLLDPLAECKEDAVEYALYALDNGANISYLDPKLFTKFFDACKKLQSKDDDTNVKELGKLKVWTDKIWLVLLRVISRATTADCAALVALSEENRKFFAERLTQWMTRFDQHCFDIAKAKGAEKAGEFFIREYQFLSQIGLYCAIDGHPIARIFAEKRDLIIAYTETLRERPKIMKKGMDGQEHRKTTAGYKESVIGEIKHIAQEVKAAEAEAKRKAAEEKRAFNPNRTPAIIDIANLKLTSEESKDKELIVFRKAVAACLPAIDAVVMLPNGVRVIPLQELIGSQLEFQTAAEFVEFLTNTIPAVLNVADEEEAKGLGSYISESNKNLTEVREGLLGAIKNRFSFVSKKDADSDAIIAALMKFKNLVQEDAKADAGSKAAAHYDHVALLKDVKAKLLVKIFAKFAELMRGEGAGKLAQLIGTMKLAQFIYARINQVYKNRELADVHPQAVFKWLEQQWQCGYCSAEQRADLTGSFTELGKDNFFAALNPPVASAAEAKESENYLRDAAVDGPWLAVQEKTVKTLLQKLADGSLDTVDEVRIQLADKVILKKAFQQVADDIKSISSTAKLDKLKNFLAGVSRLGLEAIVGADLRSMMEAAQKRASELEAFGLQLSKLPSPTLSFDRSDEQKSFYALFEQLQTELKTHTGVDFDIKSVFDIQRGTVGQLEKNSVEFVVELVRAIIIEKARHLAEVKDDIGRSKLLRYMLLESNTFIGELFSKHKKHGTNWQTYLREAVLAINEGDEKEANKSVGINFPKMIADLPVLSEIQLEGTIGSWLTSKDDDTKKEGYRRGCFALCDQIQHEMGEKAGIGTEELYLRSKLIEEYNKVDGEIRKTSTGGALIGRIVGDFLNSEFRRPVDEKDTEAVKRRSRLILYVFFTPNALIHHAMSQSRKYGEQWQMRMQEALLALPKTGSAAAATPAEFPTAVEAKLATPSRSKRKSTGESSPFLPPLVVFRDTTAEQQAYKVVLDQLQAELAPAFGNGFDIRKEFDEEVRESKDTSAHGKKSLKKGKTLKKTSVKGFDFLGKLLWDLIVIKIREELMENSSEKSKFWQYIVSTPDTLFNELLQKSHGHAWRDDLSKELRSEGLLSEEKEIKSVVTPAVVAVATAERSMAPVASGQSVSVALGEQKHPGAKVAAEVLSGWQRKFGDLLSKNSHDRDSLKEIKETKDTEFPLIKYVENILLNKLTSELSAREVDKNKIIYLMFLAKIIYAKVYKIYENKKIYRDYAREIFDFIDREWNEGYVSRAQYAQLANTFDRLEEDGFHKALREITEHADFRPQPPVTLMPLSDDPEEQKQEKRQLSDVYLIGFEFNVEWLNAKLRRIIKLLKSVGLGQQLALKETVEIEFADQALIGQAFARIATNCRIEGSLATFKPFLQAIGKSRLSGKLKEHAENWSAEIGDRAKQLEDFRRGVEGLKSNADAKLCAPLLAQLEAEIQEFLEIKVDLQKEFQEQVSSRRVKNNYVEFIGSLVCERLTDAVQSFAIKGNSDGKVILLNYVEKVEDTFLAALLSSCENQKWRSDLAVKLNAEWNTMAKHGKDNEQWKAARSPLRGKQTALPLGFGSPLRLRSDSAARPFSSPRTPDMRRGEVAVGPLEVKAAQQRKPLQLIAGNDELTTGAAERGAEWFQKIEEARKKGPDAEAKVREEMKTQIKAGKEGIGSRADERARNWWLLEEGAGKDRNEAKEMVMGKLCQRALKVTSVTPISSDEKAARQALIEIKAGKLSAENYLKVLLTLKAELYKKLSDICPEITCVINGNGPHKIAFSTLIEAAFAWQLEAIKNKTEIHYLNTTVTFLLTLALRWLANGQDEDNRSKLMAYAVGKDSNSFLYTVFRATGGDATVKAMQKELDSAYPLPAETYRTPPRSGAAGHVHVATSPITPGQQQRERSDSAANRVIHSAPGLSSRRPAAPVLKNGSGN